MSAKKIIGGALAGVSLLFILLVIFLVIFMENGSVPYAYAVSGDQLKQSVIESFLENDILRGGEEIDYYYSSDLFSFLENGSFFTKERVVFYKKNGDGRITVKSAVYEDIKTIKAEFSDSWGGETVVTIMKKNGDSFFLKAANSEGLDKLFYNSLIARWEYGKSPSP